MTVVAVRLTIRLERNRPLLYLHALCYDLPVAAIIEDQTSKHGPYSNGTDVLNPGGENHSLTVVFILGRLVNTL